MNITRNSHPDIWRALEDLGVGRLAVQVGREREIANVYRANDAARRLTDTQFVRVLNFTRTAFDLAVDFAESAEGTGGADGRARARTRKKSPAR
jgi:hypothetical protein